MLIQTLKVLVILGWVLFLWLSGGLISGAQAADPIKPYPPSEIWRNPIDEKLKEIGVKIDLNNSNVMAFRRYPGLYPNLARKIIENAPFDTVEAVLEIPGLSDRERELLTANLENFMVTPPEPALIEGADRINPGIYK